jgi:hypothetical protein
MLPPSAFTLVEGPEITFCTFCAQRFPGRDPAVQQPDHAHGLFVSIDPGSRAGEGEQVAGTVEKIDEQATKRAYTLRDGLSGGLTTLAVERPQVCWECIERMGELIGWSDTLPVRSELEETRAELNRERERP